MRPHLSPSQLGTYLKCGEAWRRRYVEGHKVPPGIAAHIGSGVHAADQSNFTQKIKSYVDLKPSEMRDIAVAGLDARIEQDGVAIGPEDGTLEAVVGEARDVTSSLAYVHATQVGPAYQPVAVEKSFKIPLERYGIDLIGYIDLVDDKGRIIDVKTTSRRKVQDEVDSSLQLTTYSVAYWRENKAWPSSVLLDVTMRDGERYTLESGRDHNDGVVLASTVEMVWRGIQSGVFAPAPAGSWYCYSMDTDLLFRDGCWRPGWKAEVGDVVACYDGLTGLLSWQPVQHCIRKPWRGPMVEYAGRGLRYKVTPDHKMLIRSMGRGRWRTSPAGDLVGKGSICYPVSAYLPRQGVALSDDEIALSGWLCAEGHFEDGNAAVCLYQKSSGQYYHELHALLQRLGYGYKTWHYDNCDKLRIIAAAGHYVRDKVQSTKAVPNWLWDADARQFHVWLLSFLKGDGSNLSGDWHNWSASQKDESFIDQLQALCSITRISASKGWSHGAFRLSGLSGITERITESAKAGTHFVESSDEEVWCVTVPTGFVMTRYRGRTLIAGNCSPKWCGYWATCPFVAARRRAGEH